jgi:hypothetical protein
MTDTNTVILRVQLDEDKTEDRIKELVLLMEATRKAQASLTLERKAGTISDEVFAQQTVKLANQLTLQRAEQNSLTKSVDQFRTATTAGTGSIDSMRAQLALATKQVNALSEAERKSEAGQVLVQQVNGLSTALKEAEQANGDFRRSVGNYPKSEGLEALVQQLVTLQEQQKRTAAGTQEAQELTRQIGFVQQAAAQQGAKLGKTYEETTSFVEGLSAAIRPATAELLDLTQQQQAAAESGAATGEAMQQIGFKIGQAQKSIKDATDALKEVPAVAAEGAQETQGLGAGLLNAARSSDVLGGAIEVLSGAKEKYTVAANLAKAATAGEVTVLGALKLALLATGLGAFVVILGSVVTFLTKTQAGADLVSRKMAALGAVVRVVTNLAAEFGGKLVAAAENPAQAFEDLLQFLETNVANKAIGVLIDAVRNRDLNKLGDGVIQLATGITGGTAKLKAFGTEVSRAASTAEQLTAESQRLLAAERALNVARDESRARIEGLKKLSDDSTKSVAIRTAAAKQAAQIENGLLAEQQRLQDAKIRNLQASQALQKNLTNEDLDQLAELRRERANTAQESLTLQTELQNKINSLATESADKRVALRKEELDRLAQAIDRQLKTVQIGSDEELQLLRQKLQNSYQAELNVKNLTVKAKRAIDENYESNRLAQELDFNRRRLQAALQAASDITAAELSQQRAGSDEALRLQAQQIEQQRALSIAGLAANTDNTAKIAALNAAAAQQQRQLEYADATKQLTDYLDLKRQAVELDYAKGLIQEDEYQRRLSAITTSGLQAQAVVNEDYQQDNSQNRKQAIDEEIAQARRTTEVTKFTEKTKQDIKEATLQAAINHTDTIINLFGEESQAGQAALAIKKVLGLAEIALNLQKVISANKVTAAQIKALIPPPAGVALGIAYEIAADAVAITAAAAQAAEILKLEQGGIAVGPSHAQGGIPLYRNGRPAGIEIEGGEPVLTKRVSQNPLLLSLASAVNQLAGGRALTASLPAFPRMALGGVTTSLMQQQLRGDVAAPIDYDRLGRATAKALRENPPVNRWTDFQAAQNRATFTEKNSST